MSEQTRNFLILGIIILVVINVASAQHGTVVLNRLLNVIFVAFFAWFFWQARKRNEAAIARMKVSDSVVLHASAVLFLVVLFTGTVYPNWGSGGGLPSVEFFVLLAGSAFGIYYGWQRKVGW